MPIYEFECARCRNTFEKVVRLREDSVICPECGSRNVKKLVSACSVVSRGKTSGALSCAGCSASSCATCGK